MAEYCPSVEWNDIWSKYQEAYEAEAAEIQAQMGLDEGEEEEDDAVVADEATRVDEAAQGNEMIGYNSVANASDASDLLPLSLRIILLVLSYFSAFYSS